MWEKVSNEGPLAWTEKLRAKGGWVFRALRRDKSDRDVIYVMCMTFIPDP